MKRLFLTLLLFCAIFVAKADEWTGTGFALKGKYVITNHHVVDGARTLQVRGVRGDFTKMYTAVVVAKDESHDMAIIRIEDSRFFTHKGIDFEAVGRSILANAKKTNFTCVLKTQFIYKTMVRTSLAVQWLGLHASIQCRGCRFDPRSGN